MTALPTLFVSHGAPTLALAPEDTGEALARVARKLTRPEAILMVSAHWDTQRPAVSAAEQPETIYDFYGFPEALYRLTYPAPGTPPLARRVKDLLDTAGLPTEIDPRRGLDHGAWVPLRMMFPDADIPVTQLAIQSHRGPDYHYRLGQALRALPSESILVIGSGSLTHNLAEFGGYYRNEGQTPDYVRAFQDWMHEKLATHDVDALLDYRRRAPGAVRAHPTEDHLLPLFVALGAAPEAHEARRIHDSVTYGVLAMDIYAFAPLSQEFGEAKRPVLRTQSGCEAEKLGHEVLS